MTDHKPSLPSNNYWTAIPVPCFKPMCDNCQCDLFTAIESEYAGFSDSDGIEAELDDLFSCPKCDWPLHENSEQCLREEADEEGMELPYDQPLRVVHEYVRLARKTNAWRKTEQ